MRGNIGIPSMIVDLIPAGDRCTEGPRIRHAKLCSGTDMQKPQRMIAHADDREAAAGLTAAVKYPLDQHGQGYVNDHGTDQNYHNRRAIVTAVSPEKAPSM